MSDLTREFAYYLEHQGELVAKYEGKFLVIKDQQVLGAFDSELSAVEETSKHHAMGTFLVQKVASGDSSYSQTFYSRVLFAE